MRGHLPRFLVLSILSLFLVACGGGGGGSSSGGAPTLGGGVTTGTGDGATVGTPTLSISILDLRQVT